MKTVRAARPPDSARVCASNRRDMSPVDDAPPASLLGSAAAAEWRYLAEGGAHVVLEHRGANPAFARRVLRLRKASRGEAVAPRSVAGVSHDADDVQARVGVTDEQLWAGHPGLDGLETMTAEERTRAFVRSVLRPVLSDALTDPGEVVRVDAEFLAAVARAIAPSRPPARVAVADVDLDARRATLLQNRNLLDDDGGGDEPTRAIEIKPKCGYVHHLNPHGISRFRMHQALRVARGEASRASGYDPLDLFAVAGADADADVETNAARARRALRALAADPRNNLRAWISLRGRGARRVEGMNDGHAAAAGKGSGSATGTSDAASVDVAEIVLAALVRSRVLARVLAAQRLDVIGVERAAVLAREWASTEGGEREAATRALRDFVVAATAKDCSVMLAFRRITRRGRRRDGNDGVFEVEVPTRGNGDGDGDDGDGDADDGDGDGSARFACRVAVVDLDMKSIQKLPRWLALDREISAHWVASSAGCDAEGNAGTRREETTVGGG